MYSAFDPKKSCPKVVPSLSQTWVRSCHVVRRLYPSFPKLYQGYLKVARMPSLCCLNDVLKLSQSCLKGALKLIIESITVIADLIKFGHNVANGHSKLFHPKNEFCVIAQSGWPVVLEIKTTFSWKPLFLDFLVWNHKMQLWNVGAVSWKQTIGQKMLIPNHNSQHPRYCRFPS